VPEHPHHLRERLGGVLVVVHDEDAAVADGRRDSCRTRGRLRPRFSPLGPEASR
jgi:hypothetical protein